MEQVYDLFARWEHDGEVSHEDAIQVFEELDKFMDHQFTDIAGLIKNDEPEAALSVLIATTNYLSAVGRKVPGIISKLQRSISRYQAHATALGKKLNAESLTISVGFPSGVTVSLTWNI